MLYLITGASGSGKSEYAEDLVCRLAAREGKRYKLYIATMESESSQARVRIARHRKQREGKGFITIESPFGFAFASTASAAEDPVGDRMDLHENLWQDYDPADSIILLECLSNLLSNLMFLRGMNGAQAAEQILARIKETGRLCHHIVIVTNEIFSDGNCYEKEIQEYIRTLGTLNRLLAGLADVFCEVVYSVPLCLKGEHI